MQVLGIHGVPEEKMKTFDVLEDSELRQSIKEFSYVSHSHHRVHVPLTDPRSVIGQQYRSYTSTGNSLVAAISY